MSNRILKAQTTPPRRRNGSLVLMITLAILLALTLDPTPGGTVQADTVAATVAAGDGPRAVAVNPVTNKIYVANQSGRTVTVIDGRDHSTTTVTAGSLSVAVAVNPVTNKIYVANASSGDVTVIDGGDNSTTTVTVGTNPTAVAVVHARRTNAGRKMRLCHVGQIEKYAISPSRTLNARAKSTRPTRVPGPIT